MSAILLFGAKTEIDNKAETTKLCIAYINGAWAKISQRMIAILLNDVNN